MEIHRAYFPALPASTFYSVRMITGGTTAATAATACHANTIGPTVQTSFSIATGSEDTFAAYGSPAVPSLLRAATLQDSTGRPGDGTIMVRLFNAATSVPVIDSGYNVGGSWVMGTSGTP